MISKVAVERINQTSAIPTIADCEFVEVSLRPFDCAAACFFAGLTGLSPVRTALTFCLIQGLMRARRPALQNSAHPRAKANAQQTRIIGTRTSATTMIAVFCLGFMAIPIQLNPILPCKDTIEMEYSDMGIDRGTRSCRRSVCISCCRLPSIVLPALANARGVSGGRC